MSTKMIRNNNGLSYNEILSKCPSVFANEPHESRSERYTYIPTFEILEALKNEGFIPTCAMQSGSRTKGKAEFTKHLLRLRKRDDLTSSKPDINEIVLVNSHDGTSSYQLHEGVFRCVCTNGLITGDINNQLRVHHKGNIKDNIIEAAYEIIDDAAEKMEIIQEMKHIELNKDERLLLAKFSLDAKVNNKSYEEGQEEVEELPFNPEKLLNPRRYADNSNDLYTTFNTIQENIIKGGVRYISKDMKRKTTRAVNSIDSNVKINKMLWAFSQEMLKLKKG
jgi:hypothetical protein